MTAIPDSALRQWLQDGFCFIPGLLDESELAPALAELPALYPTGEEFAADVDPERNAAYRERADDPVTAALSKSTLLTQRRSQFAGQLDFPWTGPALNRLTVHPKVVRVAADLLGTSDLRIYQAQLWAKYTGATNYAQPLHMDYSSHTLLVPRKTSRPQQVQMFLYLTDVSADLGPTKLVPRPLTLTKAAVPYRVWPDRDPGLYAAEVSFPGKVGSLLVYACDIWHRGEDLTEPGGARIWMNLAYKVAGAEWIGLQSFNRIAMSPHWKEFVAGSTPEQLVLFGFPPPGHDEYDADVLEGMAARYPGLNLEPWWARLGDPPMSQVDMSTGRHVNSDH